MRQYKVHGGDTVVTIKDDQETKDKVFEKVVEWLKENGAYSGEQIHQKDECIINAPELISDIVDDILEAETEDDE